MAGQVAGNTASRRQSCQPSRDKIRFNPANIIKAGVSKSASCLSITVLCFKTQAFCGVKLIE
jgi:hypothetical protein